jgi:perosamine synthetase
MKIPQFKPYIGAEEYKLIKECFDNNWITEGKKSAEFVNQLNELVGVKYGVLAPNGTLSLYLGLKALGIGRGDEVIVPNFSFYASASSVIMAGAKPVFAEVDIENLQVDVSQIEKKITRKTKAIMPVHVYGMSCNMEKIMHLSKKHKLKIIEDAAQGIGLKFKGKHVGSFGEIGSFSFFADKTITTAEGGYVCTNSQDIHNKLLYLRNQGRINRGSFIHPELGFNFRMNDIQSSMGLAQLKKLDLIIKTKNENFALYNQNLNQIKFKIIKPIEGSTFVPFRIAILFDEIFQKEKTEKELNFNGVETRTFFYPLNKQPYFKRKNNLFFKTKKDSVTLSLYERGICLPSYIGLSEKEIIYICKKINDSII